MPVWSIAEGLRSGGQALGFQLSSCKREFFIEDGKAVRIPGKRAKKPLLTNAWTLGSTPISQQIFRASSPKQERSAFQKHKAVPDVSSLRIWVFIPSGDCVLSLSE